MYVSYSFSYWINVRDPLYFFEVWVERISALPYIPKPEEYSTTGVLCDVEVLHPE